MEFTNNWFNGNIQFIWKSVIIADWPKTVLEIGSYEGASTCFLISNLACDYPIELHCVDTWEGGVEHAGFDMAAVEQRFHSNVREAIEGVENAVDLHIHKSRSDKALARMLAGGLEGHFDFIYIDGSHLSHDVLFDAVVAFKLLKVGGVMAFDDYLWRDKEPHTNDVLWAPKIAIDSFVNINYGKLKVYGAPLYQLYIRKISD